MRCVPEYLDDCTTRNGGFVYWYLFLMRGYDIERDLLRVCVRALAVCVLDTHANRRVDRQVPIMLCGVSILISLPRHSYDS